MFCEKCGKENPEGAKFCKSCGTMIGSATATVSNNAYAPTMNNVSVSVPTYAQGGTTQNVTVEEFYNNHYSEKGKKTFKGLTIGTYIAAAILMINYIMIMIEFAEYMKMFKEASVSFPGQAYLFYLLPVLVLISVIGMHLKKNVICAIMGFAAIILYVLLVLLEVLSITLFILPYACIFWYAKEVIIINKAHKQFMSGNYTSK